MTWWQILVVFFCLVLTVIIIASRVNLKVNLPERKAKEAGHAPAETPVHVAVHHPASGGGHDHTGGHDAHPKRSWQWHVIVTCVTLVVALLTYWFVAWWLSQGGFGQTPGLSREARAAINANTGTMPSATFTSASTPSLYVRSPLEAPAQGDGWSDWVYVSSGQKIVSCEADDNLYCTDTEADVAKIGYIYQCMDLKGEVHNWSVEACEKYVAVRVQSKSNIALNLAVWREPYSG